MANIIILNRQNDKITKGYFIFIFIILPVTLTASRFIFLVVKKKFFISRSFQKKVNKKLKKNSKKITNLKKFFNVLAFFLFFFNFLNVNLSENLFLLKILNNVLSQFGLFFYYRFGFILPIFVNNLRILEKSPFGVIFTTFLINWNYQLIKIIKYFHKLIKKFFNKSERMYILSALFQIFCNFIIILSGVLIWFSILLEFLLSTGSLSIFFTEFSLIFPNIFSKNIVFLPKKVIKSIKTVTFFIIVKQRNEFLACDTKLKKVIYISSKSMLYIAWFFYVQKTVKSYYSFSLKSL